MNYKIIEFMAIIKKIDWYNIYCGLLKESGRRLKKAMKIKEILGYTFVS